MNNERDDSEHIREEAIHDEQGNPLISMSEDEAEFYRLRPDQAQH